MAPAIMSDCLQNTLWETMTFHFHRLTSLYLISYLTPVFWETGARPDEKHP